MPQVVWMAALGLPSQPNGGPKSFQGQTARWGGGGRGGAGGLHLLTVRSAGRMGRPVTGEVALRVSQSSIASRS